MTKTIITFIITYIMGICIGYFIATNDNNIPVEKIIYVPVKDTISEKDNVSRIISLEYKCYELQDSLNMIKDSIGEETFVLKYKLARIKYYNDIAGKNNNIKFLRGWINRVLKE